MTTEISRYWYRITYFCCEKIRFFHVENLSDKTFTREGVGNRYRTYRMGSGEGGLGNICLWYSWGKSGYIYSHPKTLQLEMLLFWWTIMHQGMCETLVRSQMVLLELYECSDHLVIWQDRVTNCAPSNLRAMHIVKMSVFAQAFAVDCWCHFYFLLMTANWCGMLANFNVSLL